MCNLYRMTKNADEVAKWFAAINEAAGANFGEEMYPGVIEKILTHPVDGLENFGEMMRLLVEDKEALKVYVDVAEG